MGILFKRLFKTVLSLIALSLVIPALLRAETVKVCATVPELGSLVEAVGGDLVSVTVFAKGTEDPHYLDARPSFIRELSDADLFIQVGLDLEAAWAPLLLRSSRNSRIQPGGSGFLDASTAIKPIDIPTGVVDRSLGDVHPQGNPHYLTDPLNGLLVAALLRDRLSELNPENAAVFTTNYDRFRQRLGLALVGAELSKKYEFEKLALLHQHDRLSEFLKQQDDLDLLTGWLGRLLPYSGAKIITYHKSWPYFADRFGFEVAEHLEPKPGIPPGPGHLLQVIKVIKAEQIKVLLVEPWISPQATQSIASKTGIKVIRAATSTTPGNVSYDYIAALDDVVTKVAENYE
jgi:ABC-type Zn uptake system ZnuABC Zn-binding protein ZnuA